MAVRRARGRFQPIASPEEAAAHAFTAEERAFVADFRAKIFVGSPVNGAPEAGNARRRDGRGRIDGQHDGLGPRGAETFLFACWRGRSDCHWCGCPRPCRWQRDVYALHRINPSTTLGIDRLDEMLVEPGFLRTPPVALLPITGHRHERQADDASRPDRSRRATS